MLPMDKATLKTIKRDAARKVVMARAAFAGLSDGERRMARCHINELIYTWRLARNELRYV